jgi:hypothetical protein
VRSALFLILATAACSSSQSPASPPADAGALDATADAPNNDCEPLTAIAFDAGTPATFSGEAGAPCKRDIDCAKGTFCVVVYETCAPSDLIEGPGRGGTSADGAACAASPAFAADCDSLSLTWSSPQDISRSAASLAESDVALAANGLGTLVAAWVNNTTPTDQFDGNASAPEGSPFSGPVQAPHFASPYTSNDVQLAADDQGLFYELWEEFGAELQGAQHVYVATSSDGHTWSAPVQVDTPADTKQGTIPLDFPDLAISPVTRQPYFTYQVTTSTGFVPIRLVVGAPGGTSVSASVELDDGTRAGSYRDLANGAFDAAGSFYAAWVEEAGSGGSTGQGLESGDSQNAIFATRLDEGADAAPARGGPDVVVSGKGESILFGLP